MKKLFFIFMIAPFCGCLQKLNTDYTLRSLVEAERSFSRASLEKGIRAAFLTYLAEDAIVFRPKPTKGKPLYAQQQQIPGSLSWKPIHAEVAASGDFGYTTGPYEYRKNPGSEKADGCGFYVSVWKKQTDGDWRVMIDAGIKCPCSDTTISALIIDQQKRRKVHQNVSNFAVETEKARLLEADRQFSSRVTSKGIASAYHVYSADDLRYYRLGEFPTSGKESVSKKVNDPPGSLIWKPIASAVARSGDLGYTYGIMESKSESSDKKWYSYLRIWKKDSDRQWQLALDLANPIPEEKNN